MPKTKATMLLLRYHILMDLYFFVAEQTPPLVSLWSWHMQTSKFIQKGSSRDPRYPNPLPKSQPSDPSQTDQSRRSISPYKGARWNNEARQCNPNQVIRSGIEPRISPSVSLCIWGNYECERACHASYSPRMVPVSSDRTVRSGQWNDFRRSGSGFGGPD